MVVGKNKKLGKKGKGKKTFDPFLHKEWYNIRAPTLFSNRFVGKTLVTKSQGKRIASDDLKGRVYEVCLADLQNNEDLSYRKIKLICEEVQGSTCLLNYHGMNLTTDKLRSLVKKWQTLIEAHVDVKTTDNYYLRMFCIGFTKKAKDQQKKTSYAQTSQVRAIRKIMMEQMAKEATITDFKELWNKLITGDICGDITKLAQGIYPLKDVYIRKVKVLKKPKYDAGRFFDLHGETTSSIFKGKKVSRPGKFVEPVPSDSI
ncbi:small ribosomal subunit protein eS1-like [Zophobas morio]|uniref:small ribosomal subunit protein eS1-like n=1 Tax=Zophobas morio TaxID=2755281 RepID=UPI003082FB2C